jgi:xylulokinase
MEVKKSPCNVIAFDIGTTGNKACLYRLGGDGIELLAQASRANGLALLPGGGVEQDPLQWWENMRAATAEILGKAGLAGSDIAAISFCSQQQGLVLVDEAGEPLRPAMSYMDTRAEKQYKSFCRGSPSIAGIQASKLLVCLAETGVAPGSAKDPPFKYTWVLENEPDLYKKIHKWLDVKDFLVMRATGRATASLDSAFSTMLFNVKHRNWGRRSLAYHKIKPEHLPEIVSCGDVAGCLTEKAASELGLSTGCKVISGGGDSILIGIGAGAARPGDTHFYLGTSGWVGTMTNRTLTDVAARIATTPSPEDGLYIYFAELETAGKCVEWARDNIVLDGPGFLRDGSPASETRFIDLLCDEAVKAEPGAGGVVFMPWLPGNRCPFEDSLARGGFFNVSLRTGQRELLRAVLEGVVMHLRWMLEKEAAKMPTSNPIRAAGGLVHSDSLCQLIADVCGRTVQRPKEAQNSGALGAALLMAKSLCYIASLEEADVLVPVEKTFEPHPNKAYERNYSVFTRLYNTNRVNFRMLNG